MLDLSFRAAGACRQVYKDGSLAEQREMGEFADALAVATSRVNASMTQTPTSLSRHHPEAVDLSRKCCAIAKDLHDEIEKLKFQGGGRRLAMSMAIRSLRKSPMLKEKQAKLEKHARTFDSLLLMRLDTRSLRQSQDMESLDQRVRDLVSQLEQGRTTTAQLLADQSRQIRDHFDQRFDAHERAREAERASENLKASLFFPDIEARHDQIKTAFEGTFKWIFDPPTAESADQRKWSNFREWLEVSNGTYWVFGKPGSGKSTLMKYIVNEPRTVECLSQWERHSDIIVVSFFFSNLGSPLQKGATGLLRSLLFQIVSQSPDMMELAIRQCGTSSTHFRVAAHLDLLPTWTDERLLSLLRHLITKKPTTIGLCTFIDGLDEFEGDEGFLLEIVRILSSEPVCKACISSRPEQIFRTEFQENPQCRVQDLNEEDIKILVEEELKPKLRKYMLVNSRRINLLGRELIKHAEGVFLWLKLMIKDLIQGSRNGDTIDELYRRLRRTPNNIQCLYRRILQDLDPIYWDETVKLFRFLIAGRLQQIPMTLLGIVLAEEESWAHVRLLDSAHFASSSFHAFCRELHKRIIARCGNLIEIEDGPAELSNSRPIEHFQTVDFIHRTAVEFLIGEYNGIFNKISCLTAGCIPLAWANVSSLFLVPSTHPSNDVNGDREDMVAEDIRNNEEDEESDDERFERALDVLYAHVKRTMLAISCVEATAGGQGSYNPSSAELTSQTFQILNYLLSSPHPVTKNGSSQTHVMEWISEIQEYQPLCNLDGETQYLLKDEMSFASYWGCRSYLKNRLAAETFSNERLAELCQCTLSHLSHLDDVTTDYPEDVSDLAYLVLLQTLALILSHLKTHEGVLFSAVQVPEGRFWWNEPPVGVRTSQWGIFFLHICSSFYDDNESIHADLITRSRVDLVEEYLSGGANANVRIGYWQNFEADPDFIRNISGPPTRGFLWPYDGCFCIDETPLMCMTHPSRHGRDFPPIESLLRSKSAVCRRRFRYVVMGSNRQHYRISSSQSERLDKSIFPETMASSGSSLDAEWTHPIAIDQELKTILLDIVLSNDRISQDEMKMEWEIGGNEWLEEDEINEITQRARVQHGNTTSEGSSSET